MADEDSQKFDEVFRVIPFEDEMRTSSMPVTGQAAYLNLKRALKQEIMAELAASGKQRASPAEPEPPTQKEKREPSSNTAHAKYLRRVQKESLARKQYLANAEKQLSDYEAGKAEQKEKMAGRLREEQIAIDYQKPHVPPRKEPEKPVFLVGRFFLSTADGYFCLDELYHRVNPDRKDKSNFKPRIWMESNSARALRTFYPQEMFVRNGTVYGNRNMFLLYALHLDPLSIQQFQLVSDSV